MSWQKEIRPTRENSSLPLYDNAPEAATEPEPLSRREQRRLRRRTARNFSEVAQVASPDDLENETKVRESTKKGQASANKKQDGQDDANTTAETIGESSKDSPSDAPAAPSSDPETGSPEDKDCGEDADKGE
ncbi:hypothetical protein NCS57_01015100 [Fusarium keratoplasticum]|uniref:Uncharacterized protein n=1 Tax=Fusarium keratoplasticum TaxID=1328300 RepID=A0ACC0QPB1_9HYPO|nr:hypothetical protein NCS57_01015100 [Fusarium keratoplasticum]KAI8660381.1 hypothetical protein NCS57_01015100 [Fusarium keratoplasticum]